MKHRLVWLMLVLSTVIAGCSSLDDVPQRDVRELIRDARMVLEEHGDTVWPGMSAAPFGILLVEEETERLFCHGNMPEGFETMDADPVLSCSAGFRPTSFAPDMQVTFAAVDDVPVIVIGTPRGTRKTINDWVLTIFHEHFHQMQFTWDGYDPGIAGLGLGGDDSSDAWMLEYEFPYTRRRVANAFRNMADDMIKALEARGTAEFPDVVKQYWVTREGARSTVSDADWRYIELQLWQEGGARWTEAAVAALSTSFAGAAIDAEERVTRELTALNLRSHQRDALYSLGAAEAMLLEAGGVEWRSSYWSEPFSLGPQLEKLIAR